MGQGEHSKDEEDHWKVKLRLHDDGTATIASARLRLGDRVFETNGRARRNLADTDIPMVGEQLAAARALSALAHQLLDSATSDLEASTSRTAT